MSNASTPNFDGASGPINPQVLQSPVRAVFSVAELAERWRVHPESVRILIRKRKLRPMAGLRPYRITFDEVRRYETYSEEDEVRETYLSSQRWRRK